MCNLKKSNFLWLIARIRVARFRVPNIFSSFTRVASNEFVYFFIDLAACGFHVAGKRLAWY